MYTNYHEDIVVEDMIYYMVHKFIISKIHHNSPMNVPQVTQRYKSIHYTNI